MASVRIGEVVLGSIKNKCLSTLSPNVGIVFMCMAGGGIGLYLDLQSAQNNGSVSQNRRVQAIQGSISLRLYCIYSLFWDTEPPFWALLRSR